MNAEGAGSRCSLRSIKAPRRPPWRRRTLSYPQGLTTKRAGRAVGSPEARKQRSKEFLLPAPGLNGTNWHQRRKPMTLNLAQRIYHAAHLNGEFTLRSGAVSHEYFDKYLFESDPKLLSDIAQAMLPLIPPGTEVLAGLEMGGIPVVTMLSHFSGLPCIFVRKQAKTYGTAKLAEGPDYTGKHVTIVEDVVTSGGQIILSHQDLIDTGANVTAAVCVIDRQDGGREKLSAAGIKLHSLFSKSDLTPN